MSAALATLLLLLGTSGPAPGRRYVGVGQLAVRAGPAVGAPVVGWLEAGNPVLLTGCAPACGARHAWALLAPWGAVRLASLGAAPPPGALPWDAPFSYGHPAPGAVVREGPSPRARRLGRVGRAPTLLAFADDPALRARGWLRLVAGGYLPLGLVRPEAPPSALEGVPDPAGPIAFFRRRTAVPRPGGLPFLIERHAALPYLGPARGGRVRVLGATVPRAAVRLAVPRPRPSEVPAGARWVRVDLAEQTLVAYEGDRPVRAALVSTGKPGFETRPGVFRVWLKARYTTMQGRREPYRVEQVPDAQFFRGSDALHGAVWHDAFGAPVTHGCVNLAPADADWLFAWAPPALPPGWHTLRVQEGEEALWVVVEGGAAAP